MRLCGNTIQYSDALGSTWIAFVDGELGAEYQKGKTRDQSTKHKKRSVEL